MRHKQFSLAMIGLALSTPLPAAGTDSANSPWSWEVETGLGYDSNVYLAPDDSYVDYALATPQVVDPVKRSGVFVPIRVGVDYDGRGDRKLGFVGSYGFDASFYPDSKTENANEYNHKLMGGMEFLLGNKRKREDILSVSPYFAVHNKTYFNRDTGDAMVSSAGTDLSDRYSYNVTGIKVEFDRETTRFPYSLHASLARLDYVEPSSTVFDSYDHDYFRVGGNVRFNIAKPTNLTIGYDYFSRNYDERKARDLSGNTVPGTTREYIYNQLSASLRQRVNGDFLLYFDYRLTDRKDKYVGYSDYTKNSYGVRAIYSRKRVRLRAKAVWWERDYDNAFAFDNPTQAEMHSQAVAYSLKGDYALDKGRGLWTELKYVDQDSTDLRYDYERYQVMAGFRWAK